MKCFHFLLSFEKFFLPHFPTLSSSALSGRNKSSHQRCSIEKAVLKKLTTFIGKHLSWSHFLINLQVWGHATLLKRESNAGVFLWTFGYFKEALFWGTSVASVDNFKRHTRKVGLRTLRWVPRPRTRGWDPKVGLYGGTIRWDSRVGP